MVTRILLDPRRDLPGGNGFTSDPITIEATPTGVREDGSTVILPTRLTFTINTAADVFQLPAPAASWAWRVTARNSITGTILQTRTVRFPDVPSITWQALTDVDPSSLLQTASTSRQWDATFYQLVTLIGQGAANGSLAIVDNGDGTLTSISTALTDNGDGTLTAA